MSVLERKDLAPVAAATFADLFARGDTPAVAFSIRMTSGTSSGGPLTMVWENAYAGTGVYRDAERFLIVHGLMNIRLGNLLTLRTIGDTHVRMLMLDPSEVTPAVCALLDEYLPDTIHSFPALAAPLLGELSQTVRDSVRTLSYSGAGLAKRQADFFAERVPHAAIRAVYIANEAGCMSSDECSRLPRNHYHPKSGVEVAIPDTDEDGAGDIYVSTQLTKHVRLHRYHIGDVGRWAAHPCACGERMFEVLGRRGYDFIKLGSALIRQEECDRVAGLCADLFDDYQLEATAEMQDTSLVGVLRLRVYRASARLSDEELAAIADTVSKHLFVSYGKTLADLVETGAMAPLAVVASNEPLVHGLKGVRLKQLPN